MDPVLGELWLFEVLRVLDIAGPLVEARGEVCPACGAGVSESLEMSRG